MNQPPLVGIFEERTGIVTAMAAEAQSWRRILGPTGVRPQIQIECSGVGPQAASRATHALLKLGVASLFSWGTAGGLDRALAPGSIVLYTSVIDSQSGLEYFCDTARTALLAAPLSALGGVLGRGLSVPAPIAAIADKEALLARFHCAALDMESAAVAAIAKQAGIPFTALRVIVDPADFALPSSALAGIGGALPPWLAVLLALGRRPWELGALLTLAQSYRHALTRLGAAAEALNTNPPRAVRAR